MFAEITGGDATWHELVHDSANNDSNSTMVCSLSPRITNENIERHICFGYYLRKTKTLEKKTLQGIYCVIDGFNDNPNELGQIPEARAFCSRLVRTGFISNLTVSSACPQLFDNSDRLDIAKNGAVFGALEVYLVAEGLLKDYKGIRFNRKVYFKFHSALLKANSAADQALASS